LLVEQRLRLGDVLPARPLVWLWLRRDRALTAQMELRLPFAPFLFFAFLRAFTPLREASSPVAQSAFRSPPVLPTTPQAG
jgi:hypothetical protein